MAEEYSKMLLSMDGASALMAQIFGVVGLFWMLIFSLVCRDTVSSTKLIGSALVLGMAFAANHVVTYGLSIFIVATLVTELHFLEKIAALFWNRDKYWEHLQKQSPEAIVQKAEAEALEMQSESSSAGNEPSKDDVNPRSSSRENAEPRGYTDFSTARDKTVEQLLKAEDRVLQNLVDSGGYFEGGELLRRYAIRYADKFAQFDGIIKFADVHYVVEVKHGAAVRSANNAIAKTKELAMIYKKITLRQGLEVGVRPVVIFPNTISKDGVDTASATLFVFDPQDYRVTKWSIHK
ncbi:MULTISPECIES: nuclease-related domain-containing protein [unclassified Pseudomonas]|uniref:nuclease-related domain-containing protein n=1 Tax=unclassified Pseudomonas TaxID=196821 RepID=UPI000D93D142|nr:MULTISPECIES: nuclease-related domain-containing protein [unclassified Pseudomonas]PYG79882.1 hypothetical protein N428_02207 [Pseudomonas sp. RV120224-01c]PYG83614.1 hypothetical protein N436_01965 [Pseudomonas sp. RV120224-01b]